MTYGCCEDGCRHDMTERVYAAFDRKDTGLFALFYRIPIFARFAPKTVIVECPAGHSCEYPRAGTPMTGAV